MIYLWLHGHSFVFHQPVFKKIASAGLNSLRQILEKNWIFDDPFHKKGPLLVILGPGLIQPSGSVDFFDEMRLSRSLRPLRLLRLLRSLRLQRF